MELVDVRELLERPAFTEEVHRREPIEGVSTELAEIPPETPIGIDLVLESLVGGILARGPLTGTMRYRCARCLVEFDRSFLVEVSELFTVRAEEDEYPIAEGHIDLEPMIRDAIVLQIPFAPLCREDCKGLCPRCGADLNREEHRCRPQTDPRWSALESLDID